MVYLIAALVACLAVIAWQRGTSESWRKKYCIAAGDAAIADRTARQRAETDARLLADAWVLLHDEKRRGKALNHSVWLVARSEWCERWRG